MFKPGEIAVLRQSRNEVTVLTRPPAKSSHEWPVATSEGVFNETELSPAHPSVLATAEGRDPSAAFWDDMKIHTEKSGEGLSLELRDKLEEVLKAATVELNGHWRNGTCLDKDYKILEHVLLHRDAMSMKDAEDLIHAVSTKTPLDRWVPVDVGISMTLRTCPLCGEEDFETETNGLGVRIAGEPCKYPNGLPPTEWELNVPSGKLVVANDLRKLFPLPKGDDFNINTTMGCRLTALAYAANGMSHAFVGNSCPGVYKVEEGFYKIVNPPRDEAWNGKKYVPVDPKPKFEGDRVAGICTDLWWYSICDHDEFKRRCRHFKVKAKDFDVEIVKVKAGVYRFTHDEEAREQEGPAERVFTRFEWVRNPDPIRDFLNSYEAVDVNPNAYVQAMVSKWPTLYGKTKGRHTKKDVGSWSDMTEEDRLAAWQKVADQVFCTIGGGVEWHEKGFPRAKVDPSVLDVEPPSFRAQHHWYPFSKPYGGLFRSGTLAPSFAKLAFRVLESVISFGMHVNDDVKGRDVRYVRERMMVAVARYRELAKLYPEQADPEYVSWLGQKGRAEAWVKNFDLGPEYTQKHRDHAKRQRWVPADAYAVEFDARKLKDGHFAWHPRQPGVGGCWASKKDAQRYALNAWSDNGQPAEHNCFWAPHATNTSVPLYSVARVVKVGEVSHMGETLVEIAYDYGTPWMQDTAQRKALVESGERAGIRVLTKEEYDRLLPDAIKFFEEAEASVSELLLRVEDVTSTKE